MSFVSASLSHAELPPLRAKGAILLETLDEHLSISPVLEEICEAIDILHRFGHEFCILIVDDSRDDSISRIATRCQASWGVKISVLHGHGSGLGAAISLGLQYAVEELGCDLVVNLDADGQHDARQIPDLLRVHLATGAHITVGSRWIRGGQAYGLGVLRTLISKLSSLLLRVTSIPWGIKDPTTSFRVYDKQVIVRCIRESLGYDGYAFIPMIAAVASSMNLKIIEVPIRFRPRIAGISKLNAKQMKDAIRDLPRIRARRKMIERRQQFPFQRQSHDVGSCLPAEYQATAVLDHLAASERTAWRWCQLFKHDLGDSPLEVGAGLGQNTRALANAGFNVFALEPDQNLFARLSNSISENTKVEIKNSTTGELISSIENRRFSSAVYVNVLEHIEDDIAELKTVSGLLRPGGKVVVFSPALPILYATLDGDSSHFRRYTRRELRSVLERAGFVVERLEFYDQLGAILYWVTYRVFRVGSAAGKSVFLYDNVVLPISAFVTRIIGTKFPGKNLLAVGRLKES